MLQKPRFRYCVITVAFILGMLHSKVMSQPIANFSSNVVSGCAPLIVSFQDISTNNPTQWQWDLGNGVISTQKNPIGSYFSPGTFTVKLKVQNAQGQDSIVKTAYIVVNDVPTVNFSTSVTSGCFPLKVQFTDASVANSGTNTEWLWDFGDGNVSTQQNPLHTYVVAGSFTITLQVKNSKGCTKIINKPNHIVISDGVKSSFNIVQNANCGVPSTIAFNNTSIGTGVINYVWNFGDGGTSTDVNPSYTYTTAGSYNVSLLATNSSGCKDTLLKLNAVVIGAVNADFTSVGTCMKDTIRFSSATSSMPSSVHWDFGDGSTSTLLNPNKIFAIAGTYQVKMVANFGACLDSVTKAVTIRSKPTVSFSNNPNGACSAPLNVQFSNITTDAVSYVWKFGDGGTSTNDIPTYTYNQSGVFDVTLIATNSFGCIDSLKTIGAVKIALPKISSVTGTPFQGCAPYSSVFTPSFISPEPVTQVEWNFGDGSPITIGATPSHTYLNTGTYTITLIATTASGCKDTLELPNTIVLDPKPSANFSATPLSGCASDDYIFTDASSSNVTSWYWNFGDGGTSTQKNPTYNYIDTGYFKITLIVSVNSCKDTLEIDRYIYINPPVAKFLKEFDCLIPLQRTFVDKSIAPLTHVWDFGDGATSTDASPVHIYAAPGIYPVSLTVTNGACTHTAKDTLIVVSSNPNFTVSGASFCKFADVVFTVNNINPAHIANYSWDFGDGNTRIGSGPSITYQYTSSGNFTPKLTITDVLGCTQTVTQIIPIIVYGPKAGFLNPAGICINGNIPFTDTSSTDGIHNIIQWIWSYGDGAIDTLITAPFNHTYNTAGSFTVKLTLKDDFGCYDTLVKPNAVLITNPKANFITLDTLKCANSNVQFTNQSQGVGLNYKWNFGDGDSSSVENSIHAYAVTGQYTIQLSLSDIFGCTDTLVKPFYVRIANSAAKFDFVQGDSIGLCYPFFVVVSNTSINTESISWSFGDGGFSNNNSPSHFYNQPGSYSLVLKAFGFGNCVDSVKTNVVVRGPTGTFTYVPQKFCSPAVVTFKANTLNNATFFWDFSDGVTQATSDSIVTHPYLASGLFRPKMILIDAAGCQVPITGADTIKVIDIVTKIKVPQTEFCDSVRLNFLDSTVVTNDLANSYVWNFGNGVTSTQHNPQAFYSQPGNYTVSLKVTSAFGCVGTDTLDIPINVVQTPLIKITGDSVGCVNKLLSYNGVVTKSDSSAINWDWKFGNGVTSSTQNPSQQFYGSAGNYIVTAIANNASGCADTVRKNIIIHPTPNTNAGVDTFVCRGNSVKLIPTGANTYIWKTDPTLSCTNCTNPIAKPDSLNLYTVIGTNSFGCSFADSMYVNVVQPFQISVSSKDTLCVGESKQLQVIGGNQYQWSPNTNINQTNIANPIVNPTTTTIYTVIANDSKNCFKDTGTIEIKVFPIPQISFPNNTIKSNVGNSVPLTNTSSNDVTSWKWLPSTWLSCNTCSTPLALISDNIKYIVEVSNLGGCTARSEVNIETLCNGYNVFIPNTFSPNGDGMNDVFFPRGKGLFTVRNMKIFNRWGDIVFNKSEFTANNSTNGWDGTFKGKLLTPDVYVYIIEVVCDNNQIIPLKGNIMLVR